MIDAVQAARAAAGGGVPVVVVVVVAAAVVAFNPGGCGPTATPQDRWPVPPHHPLSLWRAPVSRIRRSRTRR